MEKQRITGGRAKAALRKTACLREPGRGTSDYERLSRRSRPDDYEMTSTRGNSEKTGDKEAISKPVLREEAIGWPEDVM